MSTSVYDIEHKRSLNETEDFWKEQAEKLNWFKAPKKTLTRVGDTDYKWFEDGLMNTSFMALDYHLINGRGDQLALVYDSPVTGVKQKYTYRQLHKKVAKFAGALKDLGIEKGDTVVIYMPMIPETAIAMLACARLGAIHSVVFGGFAPHELAIRIDDAEPKAIITASCGIEITRVIPYLEMVEQAISESSHKPQHTVVFERPQQKVVSLSANQYDFTTLLEKSEPVDPVPLKSNDPLYILYTSGTTGKPKGIIRDNGGHAVALKYSMEKVYGVKPGDVYWAASDVGWVVGHSYIIYAPLIHGCTTVLFEGKPIKTPDAGVFWRIIEEYQVSTLFTAPTAFRAILKEDYEAELLKEYDTSSLRTLFLAGERCDSATYYWAHKALNVPVIDHWWQTETGWPIVANPIGIESFDPKPGSATKPVPGYDVQILNPVGKRLEAGQEGYITVKLPLPPGCLQGIWKNEARFQAGYLQQFPGYYASGDGGLIDEDGYVFVMGRVDDIINVAGHRLSTGEMEEVVSSHEFVVESAVIGVFDELKGESPLGIVVLKEEIEDTSHIEAELIKTVRNQIGAVASFKKVVVVKRLPKTRSGKVLRKTMKHIINGDDFQMPSTIDDPRILDEIRETFEEKLLVKEG